MTATLSAQSSIVIHAPAAKVWEALTTPQLIKQWFFGVDTDTDWMVGSPIIHTGQWQGKPYEDKGRILKFDPRKVLAHTHWSSLSGLPDRPENYQNVTYTLTARGDDTRLTIDEVNFPSEEAKALSEKSWGMVLQALKELLEK